MALQVSLPAVSVVVLAALGGWAIGRYPAHGREPQTPEARSGLRAEFPSPPRVDDDRFESLRTELAEIRASLDALQQDAPRRIPAEPTAPPKSDRDAALEALRAEIAALRQELESGLALLRMPTPTEREAPRWNQLQATMDDYRLDREGARQQLLFTPAADLLRRFGSPTEVWPHDKGLNLIWSRDQAPGGGPQTRSGCASTTGW